MTKARDTANLVATGVPNSLITLDAAEIPNLAASKITSGTLDNARITLDAAEIPNISTDKLTSGTLANARVADLPTSKITSGTFANARISAGSVTQHVSATDLTPVRQDVLLLGLKQAIQENSTKFNLANSSICSFEADADYNSGGSTTIGRHGDEYIYSGSATSFHGGGFGTARYWKVLARSGTTSPGSVPGTTTEGHVHQHHWTFWERTGASAYTQFFPTAVAGGKYASGAGTMADVFMEESYPTGADWYGQRWAEARLDFGQERKIDMMTILDGYGAYAGAAPQNYCTDYFLLGRASTAAYSAGSNMTGMTTTDNGGNEMAYLINQYTGSPSWNHTGAGSQTLTSAVTSNTTNSGLTTSLYINSQNIFSYNDSDSFNKAGNEYRFVNSVYTAASATGTALGTTNVPTSAVTEVSGVMLMKNSSGTNTLGTDVKAYFTADNSNWTEAASYTDAGTFSDTTKMIKLGKTTCTSGSDVRWKIVYANQSAGSKVAHIFGIGLNY